MNQLWYKYFNYGTILLVAVFAILIFTKSVGIEYYKIFLYITIFIFILRIIIRAVLISKSRDKE
jgi:hypothetical protein